MNDQVDEILKKKKEGRKMRENMHIVDTETMDCAAGNRDRLQP